MSKRRGAETWHEELAAYSLSGPAIRPCDVSVITATRRASRPTSRSFGFEEFVRASGNPKKGHIPLAIGRKLHGTVPHFPNQRQLISSVLYLTPPISGPVPGQETSLRRR